MRYFLYLFFFLLCNKSIAQFIGAPKLDTLILAPEILPFFNDSLNIELFSKTILTTSLLEIQFPASIKKVVFRVNYPKTNKVFLIAHSINGFLDGIATFFYLNGNVNERVNFHNHTMEGVLVKYRFNGSLYKMIEFNNGKLHGTHSVFCENGFPDSMVEYENGIYTGRENYWHINGVKSKSGQTRHGEEFGKQTYWYDNGHLRFDGHLFNGIKVDTISFFYKNGQLKKHGIAPNYSFKPIINNDYSILEYLTGKCRKWMA